MTKQDLFERGALHITAWCRANDIRVPRIDVSGGDPARFGTCAYYRDSVIYIDVDACAGLGHAGRKYSWPGYVVDRTPYGVLAHELGHHVEGAHGAAGGTVASLWRAETKAEPLTGYCPNDNEWFAELFRLFVTNPDLLRAVRPTVYPRLLARWPAQIETRPWATVLAGADRQITSARNKIAQAERRERRLT